MVKKEEKKVVEVLEEKVREPKSSNTTFDVKDPQVLRPKELPFVITPKNGKWDNEAQREYAGYLNAYAYSNPEKWKDKKSVLLERLAEIGKDPKVIAKYKGMTEEGKLSFKNRLLEE